MNASSKEEEEDEDVEIPNAGEGASSSSTQVQGVPKIKLPTKENPVSVAIYGQICLAARSYQSAICA